MSGYPGGASDRTGTLEPEAAYIEKPFSPDSLADKIRGMIGPPR
jgi:DNA-binding response OmpR family regulator